MWPNFGYSSLLWIFDGYINVTRVLLQFFFGNVPPTIIWPELGYSSLLSKLGNIGFNGHTVQTTISWLLMLWDLWNSIVAVWCRDIYVAKQTHRGGIRAGHPPSEIIYTWESPLEGWSPGAWLSRLQAGWSTTYLTRQCAFNQHRIILSQSAWLFLGSDLRRRVQTLNPNLEADLESHLSADHFNWGECKNQLLFL